MDPAPPQSISEDSESGALMVARWRVDPSKPSQPSQRTMKLEAASLGRQFQYRTNHLPSYVSSRHAGVKQILGLYLTDHLPAEALNERSSIVKQPHWLLQIQASLILTSALESSVLAVGLAKLGRKYDNKALVREALSMYTRGLSQLRQALRNPTTRCHDETLATCLALMQFESTECPARSVESCIAHYQGAMNLLLLRPPEAYASGLAHCMYQQLRITSVSTLASFHVYNVAGQNSEQVSRFSKGCSCTRELFSPTLNGVNYHGSHRRKACATCSSISCSRCPRYTTVTTNCSGNPADLSSCPTS
jgi:hypothetical protein